MARKIFINGKWTTPRSRKTREVLNPATLKVIDTAYDCSEKDVDDGVMAARRAHNAWWRMTGVEKAGLLREIAARIKGNEKELAGILTLETGKPLIESMDCIDWTAACFNYYAEVGRACRGLSLPPVAPHQVNFTIKEPYGVVAAIIPFNFPLLLMAWKVAPALAAGNTIVIKPPFPCCLSNLALAKCFEALPPGVVNVVSGDGPGTGEALIRHPEVDLIAFTGSVEVGRHVAKVAGEQLKKVNLELGGIDPLIVLEDAYLDIAVKGACWARLLNAGQVCTSSKRIYVVDKIADEFIKRVVKYVQTLNLGDPLHDATDIGPLISREALQKIEKQVAGLRKEGAKLLIGGKKSSPKGLPGYFFEPTVFSGVKHGGIATTEEIFGPVISIIRAKNADEAIAMANDSKYGLGASVYTNNLEHAMKAMEGIKAGTFWINDPLSDNDAAPFGGMRLSGVGRELGEEGLDSFREPKHVHLDYVMEAKTYWFPYAKRPIPSRQSEKPEIDPKEALKGKKTKMKSREEK